MAKVKLGEVAREYKATVKDAVDLPVVGLEHLIPGQVELTQWSEDTDNTFTKGFKKGQMLFGRRRAYLKKAALAPFNGICSGDITVIEAIPERIMPELLPFVIQNDSLFDYAVEKSAGSLSPRVKWEHLKNYEFELPEMEHQRELVDLLWAMTRTKKAYQDLVKKTDELAKSQFVEMFADPVNNEKEWPTYRFSDVAVSRLGKILDKRKQTGLWQRRYLANANVQWFSFDLQNLNQMDFDEADQKEFELRDGDLLVCEGGEIGRCAIWHGELTDCYFQKAIHRVRCSPEVLLPEYLGHSFYYHSQKNGFSDIVSSKSTIAHLPGDKLKAMSIIVPPMELQKRFVAFLEQSDKSKFVDLQTTISELYTCMIKSLSIYGGQSYAE